MIELLTQQTRFLSMHYRRMPIEIESPEELGYETIECNLSESSFTDQRLTDLGITINDLTLFYGDHRGKPALRELLASETNVKPSQIMITPGAAPALFIIATCLLNKGDEILVAKPNYATNIETPLAIGANVISLNLKFEKDYALDMDQLEQQMTPETKLVSLTYPHNPTGMMIDFEQLKKIIEVVEDSNAYLLLDETYREMNFTSVMPVAATLSKRVISVSSMSKSYGLPGIRIGWMICRDERLMETFLAAKEQIFITNSVVDEEIAYQYLLKKEKLFPLVKRDIVDRLAIVKKFMKQQDLLEWIEPKAGCVCFPRIKKKIQIDTDQFYQTLLQKYGTYVGRGRWFEEDDRHFRIGYGWGTKQQLEKGLSNISKAIENTIQT
jgi:aspartate/methionine/tyrosine aminotransferase